MSQKVVIVKQLGVLAGFPQAEETEVKVHLDHLLAYGGRGVGDRGEMDKYRYIFLHLSTC